MMAPPALRSLSRLLAALLLAAPALLAGATPVAAAPAAAAAVTDLSSDFEDGTTQGWAGRAGEPVAPNPVAHGGTGSLEVTGRTASWQGPSIDVLPTLVQGTQYAVTAWVRLAPGAAPDKARISMERRTAGSPSYDQVSGDTAVTDTGWTELTGRYTLTTDVDFLRLYVETASTAGAFLIDDVVVSHRPVVPIQTDIPALHDVLSEFPVGTAITAAETLGIHGDLLARHFDSVTLGNALKWDATEPSENSFSYAQADPLMAFARSHAMAVRGHTLVWHNQLPAWVLTAPDGSPMTATPADKALLLARLTNHIRNVAGHYGDAIGTWDVVNEVVDETQPDGMRHSPFYTITGLDYIRTAFRVAREAAPHAKLYINDYNSTLPAKRDALYRLVKKLKGEGVPIDGVGHQMHINAITASVPDTAVALTMFRGLGVEQQITEMDVSIYQDATENFPTPPDSRLHLQACVYRDMFALFRRHAADLTSVTLWGMADDNTWLDSFPVSRKDAPLLFDTDLQAKQAYQGVVAPRQIGRC